MSYRCKIRLLSPSASEIGVLNARCVDVVNVGRSYGVGFAAVLVAALNGELFREFSHRSWPLSVRDRYGRRGSQCITSAQERFVLSAMFRSSAIRCVLRSASDCSRVKPMPGVDSEQPFAPAKSGRSLVVCLATISSARRQI